ncbi:hypothetical protein NF675_14690 [Pseudomonas siliginis]|uniref:hypothetical protein n=1 Tax=Pseudomonas siliginis TaxID=2842346 RepID=UPI002093B7CF|nr:hypothetical protein [Pseudomonas siliginis]UST72270.1 hypothetical protein NF675_14690 [Pseudomonas siliginis]
MRQVLYLIFGLRQRRMELHSISPLVGALHQMTVISTNEAGKSNASSQPFSFKVDTVGPSAPTIDWVFGYHGARLAKLFADAITDDSKLVIGGKAKADSTLVIFDKGVEMGRV